MGEFFRGWRRKAGVMTLMMACLVMFAWLRSLSLCDEFIVPLSQHRIVGGGSYLHYLILGIQNDERIERASNPFQFAWESAPIADCPDAFENSEYTWNWEWFGVGIGVLAPSQDPMIYTSDMWAIPYWSIVLPLTALSAYLLLKKPSKSNQTKITQPVTGEGGGVAT